MLRPGDTFDRYAVESLLGSGGMGSVYRAHDTRLDRRVALKVVSDASDGRPRAPETDARILREARAAAALDHPNVVSVFDVGEVHGSPFIVMELVSGRTLREALDDATLPVSRRLDWLTDVARALGAAHRRGLIHRDIKPENVMVRDDGVVKVLDFGIARWTGASSTTVDGTAPTQGRTLPALTRAGVQVGTPVYMAPEQIRGEALDGRADQFAWGVLAYELLTRSIPWRGAEAFALVASILTDDVSAEDLTRAGVSREVALVVKKALAKKPEDRFASMEAIIAALTGETPVVVPSRPPPRASQPVKRSTELERYSTVEVQAILARAIEEQERAKPDTRLGFDDLVAAASEVGVSPEVLREATRKLREEKHPPPSSSASSEPGAPLVSMVPATEDELAKASWVRGNRINFYRHFGVWLLVLVAVGLDGIFEGHVGDQLKALLIWGVVIGFQGLRAFLVNDGDWEKAQEKRRKKEAKSGRAPSKRVEVIAPLPVEEKKVAGGARLLVETGALRRMRITESHDEAEREALAEAEAAAAGRSVRRERR